MALSPDDRIEVYMDHCGCECPQYEDCPHMNENGTCDLDEPWLDCDDFQCEFSDAIDAAEREIARREGHSCEEEDESDDDW